MADKPSNKSEFQRFDDAVGKLFKLSKAELEKRPAQEKKHGKGKHRKAG